MTLDRWKRHIEETTGVLRGQDCWELAKQSHVKHNPDCPQCREREVAALSDQRRARNYLVKVSRQGPWPPAGYLGINGFIVARKSHAARYTEETARRQAEKILIYGNGSTRAWAIPETRI
jgi:hypothetical protein